MMQMTGFVDSAAMGRYLWQTGVVMKNYVERFGRSLRVSFDTNTKTFVEVPVDQLRFMPSSVTAQVEQPSTIDDELAWRYAAE
jgi:hypothetical protein